MSIIGELGGMFGNLYNSLSSSEDLDSFSILSAKDKRARKERIESTFENLFPTVLKSEMCSVNYVNSFVIACFLFVCFSLLIF